jgi:ankyrin repeat protein
MSVDQLTFLIACDAGLADHVNATINRLDAKAASALVNYQHTSDSSSGYNRGATPVMLAARSGHLALVQYLLVQGAADPHAVDAESWNALHYACFNGHADIAALLHGKPYCVDNSIITTFERSTPEGFAVYRRFSAAVAALHRDGSEFTPPAPLTHEEMAAALDKCVEKLRKSQTLKSRFRGRFLFRYVLQQDALDALQAVLSPGGPPRVQFAALDTLLTRDIFSGNFGVAASTKGEPLEVTFVVHRDHSLHCAEAAAHRAAWHARATDVFVVRASSISSVEHFIVLARVPRAAVYE